MHRISWSLLPHVLVLSFLMLVASCSPEQDRAAGQIMISGGTEAGDYGPAAITSSVVALAPNSDFFDRVRNHGASYCSGVLVSEDSILTAAHCTEMLDRQMTLVVFGRSMAVALADPRNHVRQVAGFVRHPDYPVVVRDTTGYPAVRSPYAENPELWMRENPGRPPHDLAIVRFSGGLPGGFAPARLASSNAAVPQTLTLAGFGITDGFNVDTSGTLRFVSDVRVHPLTEDDALRLWLPVAETSDVREDDPSAAPRGACPGDSGGPAFALDGRGDLVVLGILSLGESARFDDSSTFQRCLRHRPGEASGVGNLYIDLRTYTTWIDDTLQRKVPSR